MLFVQFSCRVRTNSGAGRVGRVGVSSRVGRVGSFVHIGRVGRVGCSAVRARPVRAGPCSHLRVVRAVSC